MKKFISIFLVLIISLFTNSQIANTLEENVIKNENMQIDGTKDNKVKDDSLKSSNHQVTQCTTDSNTDRYLYAPKRLEMSYTPNAKTAAVFV